MLLQRPVGPLMEGHDVTLRCRTNHSGSGAADFFKHSLLVGTSPAGHMTIRNFSKSDEGAYKCRDGAHRESPPTWLLMDGELPVLELLIHLVCWSVLVFWWRLVEVSGAAGRPLT